MTDRLPPFSESAERAALGCVLLAAESDPAQVRDMLGQLSRSHFYDRRDQEVYAALRCLALDGRTARILEVVQWLRDKGRMEAAGGDAYVSALPDTTPGAASLDQFLPILQDKANRRALLALAARAREAAYDEALDPKVLPREFAELAARIAARGEEPREWFRFYSPAEICAHTSAEGLVLVGESHITRGSVAVIAGAPGVGKSRAAHSLAVAGASGANWFGLPVHRQFKTAVIQNENGLHRLQAEFAEADAAALEDWVRVSDPPPFGMAFDQPEFCRALVEWLARFQPDLVVIDPWNSVARDDGQRDYLATFQAIRGVLPKGDATPALVIVAHTRKPRSGDERKTGRGLLNDVAGSHVLVSVPRCVFVMQAASDDPDDDRVVWTCCKNNDGALGNPGAWRRRNGLFVPCAEFDWEEFGQAESGGRKAISETQVRALFEGGRKLERKHAAQELLERTGFGRTACYEALSPQGKFGRHLTENTEGLLAWRD